MKITRNTLRADGLTVGEAMDYEAQFLRGLGFPAKDGAPTYDERKYAFRDRVRHAILDGLDDEFGPELGWKDAELGNLFRAADAHAEVLWNRLTDEQQRAPDTTSFKF